MHARWEPTILQRSEHSLNLRVRGGGMCCQAVLKDKVLQCVVGLFWRRETLLQFDLLRVAPPLLGKG